MFENTQWEDPELNEQEKKSKNVYKHEGVDQWHGELQWLRGQGLLDEEWWQINIENTLAWWDEHKRIRCWGVPDMDSNARLLDC